MGKQSRLRRMRREVRAMNGPPGEPLRILRGLHKTIQATCNENGNRCWQYLLEMMAISSGWDTESNESQHLWEPLYNDSRFLEYFECWNAEVAAAKANRTAFSEPFGQLLEEINGTNQNLGQYFTPMPVVRMMNELTLQGLDDEPPNPTGMPTHRGLDPCCGTGRFLLDALVHNDNLVMHGMDLDNWMLRAAKVNVRLISKWTSLRLKDPGDLLKPLRRSRKAIERMMNNPFEHTLSDEQVAQAVNLPKQVERPDAGNAEPSGDILILGGRSIFLHGDANILDLDYTPNWLVAGWAWTPHPWQWNCKMRGYHGSYEDWENAGRPSLEEIAAAAKKDIQFDYSMRAPTPAP